MHFSHLPSILHVILTPLSGGGICIEKQKKGDKSFAVQLTG